MDLICYSLSDFPRLRTSSHMPHYVIAWYWCAIGDSSWMSICFIARQLSSRSYHSRERRVLVCAIGFHSLDIPCMPLCFIAQQLTSRLYHGILLRTQFLVVIMFHRTEAAFSFVPVKVPHETFAACPYVSSHKSCLIFPAIDFYSEHSYWIPLSFIARKLLFCLYHWILLMGQFLYAILFHRTKADFLFEPLCFIARERIHRLYHLFLLREQSLFSGTKAADLFV